MSSKRTNGSAGGKSLPAAAAGDSAWLSTSDRLDFAFKKRTEKIDWRRIAGADIERIVRTVDFDALQDNILNITFCDIENELDMRSVDPNFLKLFRLAQMTIEYLLHSQDYLMIKLEKMQTILNTANNELYETKAAAEKIRSQLSAAKSEAHKRKRIIAAQQLVFQNGSDMYHKCPCCIKAFINRSFLDAHIVKRHPSIPSSDTKPLVTSAAPPAVERLPPVTVVAAPSEELESIRDQLKKTELRLSREIEARSEVERKLHESSLSMDRKLRQEMEAWQESQKAEYQRDIERCMRHLQETNEKLRIAEAALQSKNVPSSASSSNVGQHLEHVASPGTGNFERLELQRQREEFALLKEQLLAERGSLAKRPARMQRQLPIPQYDEEHTDANTSLVPIASVERAKPRLDEKRKRPKSEVQESPDVRETAPVAGAQTPARTPQPASQDTEENVDNGDENFSEEEVDTEDLSTTQGTGTLPTFDGSLSLADKGVQERIQRELEVNPQLLQAAKQKVIDELESALAQRGITPDVAGLVESRFKTVLATLQTERTQLSKEIKNFYQLRNQFSTVVEGQAKDKIAASLLSAATPPQPPPRKNGRRLQNKDPRDTSPEQNAAANALSISRLSHTTADSMTFTGTTLSESGSFDTDTEDNMDQDNRGTRQRNAAAPPGNDSRSEEISDWDDDSASSLEEAVKPSSLPVMPRTGQRAATLPARPSANNQNQGRHSDNDMSLRSVSSLEDAATPRQASSVARQPVPRGIIQSSGEPTSSFLGNDSIREKKFRASVTFSDELESVEAY